MNDASEMAPPGVDEIVERKQRRALDETALRSIFLEARTANGFLDRPVPHELVARAVELAQLGPTSANALPMRLVFVGSATAKQRLSPALSEGNAAKTSAAPLTAIVACDPAFYEHFPRTFPRRGEEMRTRWLDPSRAEAARQFAWDNALLEMAYFIVALRAVGLDCGPMGGFDRAKVDAEFFPDGAFKTLYLINIGYGDDTKVFARLPRFDVPEIATFL